MQTELVPIDSLTPDPANARKHGKRNLDAIAASLARWGQQKPIVVDGSGVVWAGNGTLAAAVALGWTEIEIVRSGLVGDDLLGFAIADNRTAELAGWSDELGPLLASLTAGDIPTEALGFSGLEIRKLIAEPSAPLADRFGAPPFSVLDCRQGYWQDRKRSWIGLGIQGELGRGLPGKMGHDSCMGTLSGRLAKDSEDNSPVVSIFDPVVCELAYRWFCPPGSEVFDPFAGGSVRGIVAAKLGRSYLGVDLSVEQVEENRRQADLMDCEADWLVGDSAEVAPTLDRSFDFVFSCPPYGNLEVYSDDARDLSAMQQGDFLAKYREIVAASCSLLRDDRFACFVVGDYRQPGGAYSNFIGETVAAFEAAGLRLYNEAIMIMATPTVCMRARKAFLASRKLGKAHQNVLVFVKGDPVAATKACGPVDLPADLERLPAGS